MENEFDVKRCVKHESGIDAMLKAIERMEEKFEQFNKLLLIGNGSEAVLSQIKMNTKHRETNERREESNRRIWRGSLILQVTNVIGLVGVGLAIYKIWNGQ